jgi:hypothetical protein
MKQMDKVLVYCKKALNFLLENGGENTFTHASILHTVSAACSGLSTYLFTSEKAIPKENHTFRLRKRNEEEKGIEKKLDTEFLCIVLYTVRKYPRS